MSLPTSALDYELPERLVARTPQEPRDAARLLVLHRADDRIEHRQVRDLPEYLHSDDLMVFNDTAVLPARLHGVRRPGGGRVEGLFLDAGHPDGLWRVMLRSNGRLRPGLVIDLVDDAGEPVVAIELRNKDGTEWLVAVDAGSGDHDVLLGRVGRTPLPPYIRRARREDGRDEDDTRDVDWYETVYARTHARRSVAAPTAGLHFTEDLLSAVDATGAERASVTLHVGPGTFRPIDSESVEEHPMHAETYEVPRSTVHALARARNEQRRILAVGTTTVRTLESLAPEAVEAGGGPMSGSTDLLIAPPYDFRFVDALLTNFHLPRSTLIALVGALVGLERLLDVYREAVDEEYRFYSYGDAMLVV